MAFTILNSVVNRVLTIIVGFFLSSLGYGEEARPVYYVISIIYFVATMSIMYLVVSSTLWRRDAEETERCLFRAG